MRFRAAQAALTRPAVGLGPSTLLETSLRCLAHVAERREAESRCEVGRIFHQPSLVPCEATASITAYTRREWAKIAYEFERERWRSSTMARILASLLFAAVALLACTDSGDTKLTVYKTPTCGCCGKWVDHLREAGFAVATVDLPDLTAVKAKNGVPPELASCHTAVVDGYVVEGHVPAADVLRLLDERPAVAGLAVPGMPIGSPGMEGSRPERYTVYAFDSSGQTSRFATHGP